MPRERSPARNKAFEIYKEHKGNITNREIANMLNEDEKKIAVWKQRDKWTDKVNVVQQTKESCTKNQKRSNNFIKKESLLEAVTELENTELTEKQRLFCIYYLKNFNATQAYLKAYGGSYEVANVEGYKNLVKPRIKAEIDRLKEIKNQSIMITEDDIIELKMRIAFADIRDFLEFGNEEIPLITKKGPVMITDQETGKEKPLMIKENILNFKSSNMIDGNLVSEVKTSRQGASIKLVDKQKAIDWLADYFGMNPEHKYRQEFDAKKLQLERERFEHQKKMDESKVW